MNEKSRRILAFGLGALLLFRGVYGLTYGTGFIEDLLIETYVPFAKYEACNPCITGVMMGSNFTGNIFINTSPKEVYSDYLIYITYALYLGEVIAPLFLIVGKYIRIASGIIAIDILVAILFLYQDNVFSLSKSAGWIIELPLFYLMISVSLVFSRDEHL